MHLFNNLNPNNFMDELINSKILPKYMFNDLKEGEYIADNIWVVFDEGVDMDLVNQIVANHNPKPPPKEPTQEEIISKLQTKVEDQNKAIAELTMMLATPTI